MLNHKQREFCRQYVVDFNSTQAAIRAGYSPKTARQQGSVLMANLAVRDEVSLLISQKAEKTQMTAQQVLDETSRMAMDPKLTPRERLRALELMGRHYNLWTESTPLEASSNGTIAAVVFYVPEKKRLPHETIG